MRPLRQFVSALLCFTFAAGATSAQDAGSAEKTLFKRWIQYYSKAAAEYDFRFEGNLGDDIEVAAKPVLTYSHPSGKKGTHGAFFVWMGGGRAAVIGSIWSHEYKPGSRSVVHEFHSLSTEPLSPVKIRDKTWKPKVGIELKEIASAPDPNASRPLRLAQMRSLVRQFKGYSRPNQEEVLLRTLPQPLVRYERASGDVLDGAVFGMFADWDPEIMLLIEARKQGDTHAWYYGVCRFNACRMRLEHGGVDAWKVDRAPVNWPAVGDPYSPYFSVHFVDKQDASDPKWNGS